MWPVSASRGKKRESSVGIESYLIPDMPQQSRCYRHALPSIFSGLCQALSAGRAWSATPGRCWLVTGDVKVGRTTARV